MIDPTSGESPLAETLTGAERDARIERLLVSGLDEYFAGRIDHAINVWTRVLFLDRANDRARAYIDRARRSQAERQREADALVHEGLQAFEHGDVDRARTLLTSAVERGAPHEQTLPVLHRIGLLDVPAATPLPTGSRTRWRLASPAARPVTIARGPWLLAALVAAAAGVAVWVADTEVPTGSVPTALDSLSTPLPVPAASEAHLTRARQLFQAGKLPDSLSVLDRVDVGDAAYGAAQALRGEIQRELLKTAEVSPGARPRP
jgi:hypothetical protein